MDTIHTRVILFGCILFSAAVTPDRLAARDFYAVPQETPNSDGSQERPWGIATALSHPSAVKPGDMVWLNGGVYRGAFTSRLAGTADAPITVRAVPGQRVTFECDGPSDKSKLFSVEGAHCVFWGFEVVCRDNNRITKLGGSWPADVNRGSIHCRASDVKFINLILHDLETGIGFWSGGEGGEVYGCIIYNNGWKGPDRAHGHAIYAQNETGTKRLVDNIVFNQFGDGIHAYGSKKASVKGFHVEGNISFNNGCFGQPGDRTRNILVGGDSPSERILVADNFTYHTGTAGTSMQLGYGAVNNDLTLTGNYCAGGLFVRNWKNPAVSGNTLVGLYTLASLEIPDGLDPANYRWDRNIYRSGEVMWTPLDVKQNGRTLALGWDEWQKKTHLDPHGEYIKGRPKGVDVFVRPNKYEPGRGHIAVYNWDEAAEVSVDLKGIVKAGGRYEAVRAQDYFGRPVASGVYSGKPVALPMRPVAATPPIGFDAVKPPVTAPQFDVFVVRPGAAP